MPDATYLNEYHTNHKHTKCKPFTLGESTSEDYVREERGEKNLELVGQLKRCAVQPRQRKVQ